jgi:hypothetical protein
VDAQLLTVQERRTGPRAGVVTRQTPDGGEQVPAGSRVLIWVEDPWQGRPSPTDENNIGNRGDGDRPIAPEPRSPSEE